MSVGVRCDATQHRPSDGEWASRWVPVAYKRTPQHGHLLHICYSMAGLCSTARRTQRVGPKRLSLLMGAVGPTRAAERTVMVRRV